MSRGTMQNGGDMGDKTPDVADFIRRSVMWGTNAVVSDTSIIGIDYLSVTLAPHDGLSEVGLLSGNLAYGKGGTLGLSSFCFMRSSTRLALRRGFHVEIFGENSSETRLNDLGPAAARGLSMAVCCAIPVSPGKPRCGVIFGWESPSALHAALARVSQATFVAKELAEGFPEDFASLARRWLVEFGPPLVDLSPPPRSPVGQLVIQTQAGASYPCGEVQEVSKYRSEGHLRRLPGYAVDAGPFPRPGYSGKPCYGQDDPQLGASSVGDGKGAGAHMVAQNLGEIFPCHNPIMDLGAGRPPASSVAYVESAERCSISPVCDTQDGQLNSQPAQTCQHSGGSNCSATGTCPDEAGLTDDPKSFSSEGTCHRRSPCARPLTNSGDLSPSDEGIPGQDSNCKPRHAQDETVQKVVKGTASVSPREPGHSFTLCFSNPAMEGAFLQTMAEKWFQRDVGVAALQAVFALAVTWNSDGPLQAWVVSNPWHKIWHTSQLLHPLVPLLGRAFAPKRYGLYREWICIAFSIFTLATSGLLWLPYSALPEVHAVLPFTFTCTLPLAAMINGLGYKMRLIFSVPERIVTLAVHFAAVPSACSRFEIWGGNVGCSILSVGLLLIAGIFIPLSSAYHFEKLERARFSRRILQRNN